jgi:hypothetical protein
VFLEADELGGADGREVGRVREQDQPLAFVVGERAVTVGGLGVEAGAASLRRGKVATFSMRDSIEVEETPGKRNCLADE